HRPFQLKLEQPVARARRLGDGGGRRGTTEGAQHQTPDHQTGGASVRRTERARHRGTSTLGTERYSTRHRSHFGLSSAISWTKPGWVRRESRNGSLENIR